MLTQAQVDALVDDTESLGGDVATLGRRLGDIFDGQVDLEQGVEEGARDPELGDLEQARLALGSALAGVDSARDHLLHYLGVVTRREANS